MDSFFFNITDNKYKITNIYNQKSNYITRVDISNSIVFFDINLEDTTKEFSIKNLDRMIFIPVVQEGSLTIFDNITKQSSVIKKNSMNLYCSSKQDLCFSMTNAKVFILFIADFFLKRYLLNKEDEPIDFLYNQIQNDNPFKLINSVPSDALSLYIIDKIIDIQQPTNMFSIKKEHSIMEYIIHRLSLIDFYDNNINQDDIQIAKKAKNYLLEHFINPPTIAILAHHCATNESKLKKVFKQVYKTTIYNYIQKLKLEEANILLKERIFNIGEISIKVGYKHQGHFSKLFFKHYGIYPKDLLK